VAGLGELSGVEQGAVQRGVGGDEGGHRAVLESGLDHGGRHVDEALVHRRPEDAPVHGEPRPAPRQGVVDARQVNLAEVRREGRQVVEHEGAVMARGGPSADRPDGGSRPRRVEDPSTLPRGDVVRRPEERQGVPAAPEMDQSPVLHQCGEVPLREPGRQRVADTALWTSSGTLVTARVRPNLPAR